MSADISITDSTTGKLEAAETSIAASPHDPATSVIENPATEASLSQFVGISSNSCSSNADATNNENVEVDSVNPRSPTLLGDGTNPLLGNLGGESSSPSNSGYSSDGSSAFSEDDYGSGSDTPAVDGHILAIGLVGFTDVMVTRTSPPTSSEDGGYMFESEFERTRDYISTPPGVSVIADAATTVLQIRERPIRHSLSALKRTASEELRGRDCKKHSPERQLEHQDPKPVDGDVEGLANARSSLPRNESAPARRLVEIIDDQKSRKIITDFCYSGPQLTSMKSVPQELTEYLALFEDLKLENSIIELCKNEDWTLRHLHNLKMKQTVIQAAAGSMMREVYVQRSLGSFDDALEWRDQVLKVENLDTIGEKLRNLETSLELSASTGLAEHEKDEDDCSDARSWIAEQRHRNILDPAYQGSLLGNKNIEIHMAFTQNFPHQRPDLTRANSAPMNQHNAHHQQQQSTIDPTIFQQRPPLQVQRSASGLYLPTRGNQQQTTAPPSSPISLDTPSPTTATPPPPRAMSDSIQSHDFDDAFDPIDNFSKTGPLLVSREVDKLADVPEAKKVPLPPDFNARKNYERGSFFRSLDLFPADGPLVVVDDKTKLDPPNLRDEYTVKYKLEQLKAAKVAIVEKATKAAWDAVPRVHRTHAPHRGPPVPPQTRPRAVMAHSPDAMNSQADHDWSNNQEGMDNVGGPQHRVSHAPMAPMIEAGAPRSHPGFTEVHHRHPHQQGPRQLQHHHQPPSPRQQHHMQPPTPQQQELHGTPQHTHFGQAHHQPGHYIPQQPHFAGAGQDIRANHSQQFEHDQPEQFQGFRPPTWEELHNSRSAQGGHRDQQARENMTYNQNHSPQNSYDTITPSMYPTSNTMGSDPRSYNNASPVPQHQHVFGQGHGMYSRQTHGELPSAFLKNNMMGMDHHDSGFLNGLDLDMDDHVLEEEW